MSPSVGILRIKPRPTVVAKSQCLIGVSRTPPKFDPAPHQNHLSFYHKLDLQTSPPLFITCLHRFGISLIRARISSIDILSHFSKMTRFNSFTLLHLRRRIRCFKIFHTYSDGLRSGD